MMTINDILAEQLASAFAAGQQTGDMSAVNDLLGRSQITAEDVQNRFGLTSEQTGGSGLSFYQPTPRPSGLSPLPISFPLEAERPEQKPIYDVGMLPYEQRQEFLDSLTPEQRNQWLTKFPNYYPDYNPLMTPYYVGEGGIGYQMPIMDTPIYEKPSMPIYEEPPMPVYEPDHRRPIDQPLLEIAEEEVKKVGDNLYKIGDAYVDALGNFIGNVATSSGTSGVSGISGRGISGSSGISAYISPLAKMLRGQG